MRAVCAGDESAPDRQPIAVLSEIAKKTADIMRSVNFSSLVDKLQSDQALLFIARRHANVMVNLSVCLLHSGVVLKRMHLSSNSFEFDTRFFERYRRYKIPRITRSAKMLNCSGSAFYRGKFLQFSTEITVYLGNGTRCCQVRWRSYVTSNKRHFYLEKNVLHKTVSIRSQ